MAPACEVDLVLADPVWEEEEGTGVEDEKVDGVDEALGVEDVEGVEDVCDVDVVAIEIPPEGVYSM